MREIYIKSKAGLLPIGRRGENLATRVHLAEVPAEGQAVTVFVKRNGDTVAYPASNVENTDTEIIWTVTSVDTDKRGRGQVQYRYTNAETGEVIKTDIYAFAVGMAIDVDPGEAPDPYETWIDSLTDKATSAATSANSASSSARTAKGWAVSAETYALNAETFGSRAATQAENARRYASQAAASANEIKSMTAEATTLPAGAEATASYSNGVLSLGIPKGAEVTKEAVMTALGYDPNEDILQTAYEQAGIQADDVFESRIAPVFSATDAMSKSVVSNVFGVDAPIVLPSSIYNVQKLVSLLKPNSWFVWLNGSEIEFSRLAVSINASSNQVIMILRGVSSIASGTMGVGDWAVVTDDTDAYKFKVDTMWDDYTNAFRIVGGS